jgi:hypothetical protein
MVLLSPSGRNDPAGSVESVTWTDLARSLREAYGAGAAAWAAGPVRMYRTLADVLVAHAGDTPKPLVVSVLVLVARA